MGTADVKEELAEVTTSDPAGHWLSLEIRPRTNSSTIRSERRASTAEHPALLD
jgi:hypothetical protein